MQDFRREFGEKIRELRADRGMNQTEFAEFLGISRPTLGFYESGQRVPSIEDANFICRKCGVSADWLLSLGGQKTVSIPERMIGRALGLSPKIARLLNVEMEKIVAANTAIDRFSCTSLAKFLNFCADQFPDKLTHIERNVRGAILDESLISEERSKMLHDFMSTSDEHIGDIRDFFALKLGADIVTVEEKRDLRISAVAKDFAEILEEYVRQDGSRLKKMYKEAEEAQQNGIDSTAGD